MQIVRLFFANSRKNQKKMRTFAGEIYRMKHGRNNAQHFAET